MGVKGLSSVLKSEPSRFGRRFVSDPEEGLDLLIDAPALLYYLISLYNKITTKSGTTKSHQPIPHEFEAVVGVDSLDNQDYSLSPYVIYKLSLAFCAVLTKCIGRNSNIHLVVDGVASMHKTAQQLGRMQQDAEELFISAKNSSPRNKVNVPHFFGEDAMIEAIKDLKQVSNGNGFSYHLHYAHGEAETYIANYLRKMDCHETFENKVNRRIILSNDSDFIVFPSVVGFIPFHSLEYVHINSTSRSESKNQMKIHGWEYLRSKFMTAFGFKDPKQSNATLLITSTIAALAGCDYTLHMQHENSLISSRKTILNTDIGGLRQKNRKNCSAKDIVTAVSRFVSHFSSGFDTWDSDECSDNPSWLDNLVENIIKFKMVSHLQKSHKQRKSGKIKAGQHNNPHSREKQKLMLKEALVNIYNIYNDGTPEKDSSMRELKRLIRHGCIYCKPVMTSFAVKDGHLWMDQNVSSYRKRIYSLMKCLLHGDFLDERSTVVEYCCINHGFKANIVNVDAEMEVCKAFLRSRNIESFDLLLYLYGIKNLDNIRMLKNRIQRNAYNDHDIVTYLLFVSLLLSDLDALMLILMNFITNGKIDQMVSNSLPSRIDKNYKNSYYESQSCIHIAQFHFNFAWQALKKIGKSIQQTNNEQHLKCFSQEYRAIDLYSANKTHYKLWSILNECDINTIANKAVFENAGQDFFPHLIQVVRREFRVNEPCLKVWEETMKYLWHLRFHFIAAL